MKFWYGSHTSNFFFKVVQTTSKTSWKLELKYGYIVQEFLKPKNSFLQNTHFNSAFWMLCVCVDFQFSCNRSKYFIFTSFLMCCYIRFSISLFRCKILEHLSSLGNAYGLWLTCTGMCSNNTHQPSYLLTSSSTSMLDTSSFKHWSIAWENSSRRNVLIYDFSKCLVDMLTYRMSNFKWLVKKHVRKLWTSREIFPQCLFEHFSFSNSIIYIYGEIKIMRMQTSFYLEKCFRENNSTLKSGNLLTNSAIN